MRRRVYRLTRGRIGLWRPKKGGWGAMRLNLQAHPDARVDLPDGPRQVRGRAAVGDERARLWARWAAVEKDQNLDGYAALRSTETAVVVLEPATISSR